MSDERFSGRWTSRGWGGRASMGSDPVLLGRKQDTSANLPRQKNNDAKVLRREESDAGSTSWRANGLRIQASGGCRVKVNSTHHAPREKQTDRCQPQSIQRNKTAVLKLLAPAQRL